MTSVRRKSDDRVPQDLEVRTVRTTLLVVETPEEKL